MSNYISDQTFQHKVLSRSPKLHKAVQETSSHPHLTAPLSRLEQRTQCGFKAAAQP